MKIILKRFAQFIIRSYQWSFSFFLGGRCRFFPTCSEYAHEAVGQFGFFRGTFKSLMRVFRCHPFHPGGYDPISK